MKIDYYRSTNKTFYICEKENKCKNCFWYNGEQCIRQLLLEGDIKEILKEQDYGINK